MLLHLEPNQPRLMVIILYNYITMALLLHSWSPPPIQSAKSAKSAKLISPLRKIRKTYKSLTQNPQNSYVPFAKYAKLAKLISPLLRCTVHI